MPLDRYFGGNGAEVMRKMKKRYGPEKGERIFYATHRALQDRETLRALAKRRNTSRT